MSDERFNDDHHLNRFPLGRRVSRWMSFIPSQDETGAAIFKQHGGMAVGGSPQPTKHFVPLMRVLAEIRSIGTTDNGGKVGANDFDW